LDAKNICSIKNLLVNLEISIKDEIVKNALRIKPNYICIVPENRKEITTEGGLNLKKNKNRIKKILNIFKKNNIRTSLFINPSLNDVLLAKELGTECIEIHTGKFATLVKSKKNINNELLRIKKSCKMANDNGIEVHAGHGLDYKSTKILSKIKEIKEFNIGHFIIGESIFFGIKTVIKKFKKIIR
jgi:pyridoxine 5-phosphate synthase